VLAAGAPPDPPQAARTNAGSSAAAPH